MKYKTSESKPGNGTFAWQTLAPPSEEPDFGFFKGLAIAFAFIALLLAAWYWVL